MVSPQEFLDQYAGKKETLADILALYGSQCYREGVSIGVQYEMELEAWHHARRDVTGVKLHANHTRFPRPSIQEFPYELYDEEET